VWTTSLSYLFQSSFASIIGVNDIRPQPTHRKLGIEKLPTFFQLLVALQNSIIDFQQRSAGRSASLCHMTDDSAILFHFSNNYKQQQSKPRFYFVSECSIFGKWLSACHSFVACCLLLESDDKNIFNEK